jgi:hypothetical protein
MQQPRGRLTSDPRVGVTGLADAVEGFLVGCKTRDLTAMTASMGGTWKSAPTAAIQGLAQCKQLFVNLLELAPNSVVSGKRLAIALKSLHTDRAPINYTNRRCDDWADEMSQRIRVSLAKLREMKESHLSQARALSRATIDEKEAVLELLDMVSLKNQASEPSFVRQCSSPLEDGFPDVFSSILAGEWGKPTSLADTVCYQGGEVETDGECDGEADEQFPEDESQLVVQDELEDDDLVLAQALESLPVPAKARAQGKAADLNNEKKQTKANNKTKKAEMNQKKIANKPNKKDNSKATAETEITTPKKVSTTKLAQSTPRKEEATTKGLQQKEGQLKRQEGEKQAKQQPAKRQAVSKAASFVGDAQADGWSIKTFIRSDKDKCAGLLYKTWTNMEAGSSYRSLKQAQAHGFTGTS